MSGSPPEAVRLYTPWRTTLKILSAVGIVWVWLRLWPIVMVVAVALVLAVTLDPVIH